MNKKRALNILIVITLLLASSINGQGFLGPLFNRFRFLPLIISSIILFLSMIKVCGIRFFLTKENITAAILSILAIFPFFLKMNYFNIAIVGVNIAILCFIYNIFRYMKCFNNKKENMIISMVIFIELLLTIIVSDYQMIVHGAAILQETAGHSMDYVSDYFNLKTTYLTGRFATAYVCPIIIIYSIYKLKNKNYWYLISLVCSCIPVIISGFFICLFGMLVTIGAYFVYCLSKKIGTINSLILTVLLGFASLVIIYYLGINGIIREDYFVKINYIYEFILEKKTFDRLDVYLYSIEGMISNKFLYNPTSLISGGHSTILDCLSIYGVLSVGLFYFFYKSFKDIKMYIKQNLLFFLVMVYVFVTALLNPVLSREYGFAIYLILPFIICYKEGC